ncbi:hypothetical protein [Niveibacterium sp. SC-1]|uniref:hypothetical protein n=1 Tax=Niveibacterium sp. SC-1 TaxID=3135646 RepID=UPI0031204D41
MRLRCWNSVWLDGEFSPERGQVRQKLVARPRHTNRPLVGWYAVEKTRNGERVPLALYGDRDTIYFQAGKQRWPLQQPGLSLEYERLPDQRHSRFVVRENGRESWEIVYAHNVRAFLSVADPAYDPQEFENDHFLFFIATHAVKADWQAAALARWTIPAETRRSATG